MLSTKQIQKQEQLRRGLPLLRQGAVFAAGTLLAGGQVMACCPLGLAFVLGAARRHLFAGAAGAALGCLLWLDLTDGMRMLGAVAAALAGRMLAPHTRWLSGAAGVGCLVLVQGMLAAAGLAGPDRALLALAEGTLAVGLGVALARTENARRKNALVWLLLLIPALESRTGPYHLGAVLAGAAGLTLAYRGEIKNAAAGAICLGCALAAAAPALLPLALPLMAGSLAGAVWAPGEKTGCAGLFGVAQICGLALGSGANAAQSLVLAGGSVLVFACLPQKYLLALPGEEWTRNRGERGALVGAGGRLTAVADALTDVAQTVNTVMEKLPKKGENYDYTVDYLARQLCAGCRQRERCWIREYNDTVKALYSLRPLLEEQQRLNVEQLPPHFYRCEQPAALCSCLCQGYAVWCSRRQSALKMTALRGALSEQYGAMAGALAKMAEELTRTGVAEEAKSSRVAALMETLGLEPLESLAETDTLGRMRVTVTLTRTVFEEEELQSLAQEVGHICRSRLEMPRVTHCRTLTTLIFEEKPVYEAEFGLASRPAEETSGDAARQFCSSGGQAHMLLCDGMGTGRPAAIDGAMAAGLATRLLQTGFEGDTTARLVNVALSLKSEEESSAALDLFTVDLYSGRGRLYKAGGAPSFVLQNGRLYPVEGAGLPVGILKEVNGREHRLTLDSGDWVVMVSDGALNDGDVWLRQQMELCAAVGSTPQEMADILADTACRRRPAAVRADDVTVAVMRLKRRL